MGVFADPTQKKKPVNPFASPDVFKEKLMDVKPEMLKPESIITEVGVISQVLKDQLVRRNERVVHKIGKSILLEGEKLEKNARAGYEKGVKLEFERLKRTAGKKKNGKQGEKKDGDKKLVKKNALWDKKFFEGGKQE